MTTEIRQEAGERVLAERYRLRERIGSGGMATVWLAQDERLGRLVAIKMLAEALGDDPAFGARFEREAVTAASLAHPNLVRVYDFDARARPPFLVMEYVPGPNLAQRMRAEERVDVRRLARDLLSALEAIHREGVVHRDVKPHNVLLAADGRARLTDFGVAKPEDASSITQTGQIPGTARYMAPELMAGEPATARSDLFACGMVLAECLEAEPVAADSEVAALVARLTDPEPRRRPRSAAQALGALDAAPAARPARTAVGLEREIPLARALAGLGILAVAIALVVALASGIGGGGPSPGGSNAGQQGARGQSQPGREQAKADLAPDPTRGAQLNDRGFALLQAGEPEAAVPVLRRAVASFPEGSEDLTYGYALFNLAKALRLSGHPEEAIPFLRERLRIPDQLETVRAELAAAREAAR